MPFPHIVWHRSSHVLKNHINPQLSWMSIPKGLFHCLSFVASKCSQASLGFWAACLSTSAGPAIARTFERNDPHLSPGANPPNCADFSSNWLLVTCSLGW